MCATTLTLGAAFGMMAAPCVALPLLSGVMVMLVPALTFAVSAPSRIGVRRELRLLGHGLEATALSALLFVTGRRRDAAGVRASHRVVVERAYGDGLAGAWGGDVERLHHVRRLAQFAAILVAAAGMALPLVYSRTFTYGSWHQAPFVVALDFLAFGLVARLVAERIAIRLLEASVALGGKDVWTARLRAAPLTTMLGGALGAVGALVVLSVAALMSGVETAIFAQASGIGATYWFLQMTGPLGLPVGVFAGAIVGLGAGLAQGPLDASEPAGTMQGP